MLDVLGIRTVGRAPVPVPAIEVREITDSDIVALQAPRGIEAPALKRLGERHHALARLLAEGRGPGEAGVMVGLTGNRVAILQSDPAFQELIAFYRGQVEEKYLGLHAALGGLALDAVNELRERLEETPKDLSPGQLIEMAKMGADRTGFGPKSTQDVNVNIGLAERMQAARERALARRTALTIESTAEEVSE